MAHTSAALFRSGSSSSLASFSSSSADEHPGVANPSARHNPTIAKRTRNRFTGTQLAMLEQLFHCTSHPSREEREALARDLDLEPKVVTIWFQNRRQNERKASLHWHNAAAAVREPASSSPPILRIRRTPHRHSRASIPHSTTTHSSPYAAHPHHSPAALTTTTTTPTTPTLTPTPTRTSSSLTRRRPTLETTARRTELRTAPPRTPTKRPDPNKSPWDNMPSSPLAPPSPPEQEFVRFAMARHKNARSLEWACAAARLVGKRAATVSSRNNGDDDDDDETDEEEPHEAITPMGSLIGDASWGVGSVAAKRATDRVKPKDSESELMDAALLLCGLGRNVA